jgi:uncharacterized protein involved in exopolysaccharide biosynthesis
MTTQPERPVFQDQLPIGAFNAPSGSGAPEGGESIFPRLDLWRALQLHRRLLVILTLAGVAAAVVAAAMMWPVYKAQSQVYIQPAAPKVLEQNTSNNRWGADANSYESFIQQEVQSVTQPAVLLGALHKLQPGDWQNSGESDDAAAERLGKSLKVERVGGSYQVTITATAASAEAVARIANALAASLIENVSHQEKAGNPERIAILKEERDRLQTELNSDRAEQESLSKQLGMAAVTTATSTVYEGESNAIRTELVKARTDHDQAAARLSALVGGKDGSSRPMDAMADEVIATDAGLNSLKTTLDQRRAILVSQMANLTPSNPQYKQDAAELAQIDASLETNVKDLRAKVSQRIQQQLRSDLARTAEVEERLNAQLGHLAGTAVGATPKLQRANDLATNIQRLQTRFATVDDQLHNLLIEDTAPGAAFLSAAATPPLHPAYTLILKKTLPLLLGGILLGLLAAIAAHKLDSRIYIAADFEHVLGFAPMAQLPDFNEVGESVAEEHIFRLSAAIEHAHQFGSLRSCIFTAIGPGAGVTTILTQVRTMLNAMGRSVTVVDTSGTPPPAAASTEAVAPGSTSLVAIQRGSRSSALLQKFAEEKQAPAQRLILTDTAPLPISAETEYLARFVDAVIVVVESGVTTRAQLRAAANTLQRLEASAVGFVLNRIRMKSADPVFRQLIQDTERHLHTQSRPSRRRPEMNSPGLPAQERTTPAMPSQSFAPIAPPAPQAPAKPPAPAAPKAVAETPVAPAAPPLSPAPRAEAPRPPQPSAAPMPRPSAAAPAPQRAEAPAQAPHNAAAASRARSEHEEIAYRFEKTLEKNTPPEPSQPPAAVPHQPAGWEAYYGVNPTAAADKPQPESPCQPFEADERSARRKIAAAPPPEPSPVPSPALSSAEQWLRENSQEHRPSSRTMRPPVTSPAPPAAVPPEILPPRPPDDAALQENTRVLGSSSRRYTPEEFDDMVVLPSTRGQYQSGR